MEPAVENGKGIVDGAGVDDVVVGAPELNNEKAGPPVDVAVDLKTNGAIGVLTLL